MSAPALLFGKGEIPVILPESVSLHEIRKPEMPVLPNPQTGVQAALENPTCPLSTLAAADSVCIVICDITRPVPNGLLLPPMIKTLLAAGIAPERICVLVATGLHRPNLGEELRELVGNDWVLETVRVENHFARNREDHVFLGQTTSGTPVGIDRRFVEADLKIVIGLVEPHFMAGYSGGRKIIAPGIAHEDTIRTFHNTDFMEHPLARGCNLEDNPLHHEQLEIVGLLGDVYAVNTVIDDRRQLSYVNFGEVLASHAEAVAFVRQYTEVPVPKSYPLIITSSAGYPLDKTLYQTIKGIITARPILEPGGVMLIASECAEGLGSEEFIHAQQRLVEVGPVRFLEEARLRPFAAIDEWQTVKLAVSMQGCSIHLYSPAMSPEQRKLTGLICHSDWATALATVLEASRAQEAAVIPEGPYVVPMIGN